MYKSRNFTLKGNEFYFPIKLNINDEIFNICETTISIDKNDLGKIKELEAELAEIKTDSE